MHFHIALFDMNSAYQRGGCKLKTPLQMAQEYFLLEGIPHHLEENHVLQERMPYLLDDSFKTCDTVLLVEKPLYFLKGKLQLK